MKKIITLLALLCSAYANAQSDSLSLSSILRSTQENFPLIEKKALQDQVLELNLNNADIAWLPRISINAQATYQSEVVEFDLPLPNFEGIDLPHARAQAYVDVQQTLYDGGRTQQIREMAQSENAVEAASLELDIKQVQKSSIAMYYSVLLTRQQKGIMENSLGLLDARIESLRLAERDGVATAMDVMQLEARRIELVQNIQSLEQRELKQLEQLEMLSGTAIAPNSIFDDQAAQKLESSQEAQMSELLLLEAKVQRLEAMSNLQARQRNPTLAAFGQAGLGYPNPLNFFDNAVAPYYLVGIRFSWQPWDWRQTDNQMQILNLQRDMIGLEMQNMERNLNIEQLRVESEVVQFEKQIENDLELIRLRIQIRELSEFQLEQGIIRSNDYLEQLKLEEEALLQNALHRAQLDMNRVMLLHHKEMINF